MCLSKSSTIARATSALPLTGAAPAATEAWSMMLTSTTVSSGPSFKTLTSTFRRLSPSSIRAASTASSRVRPRPSADFIAPTSSIWFPSVWPVLRSILRSVLGSVLGPVLGPILRATARPGPRSAAWPVFRRATTPRINQGRRARHRPPRQQVSPADHKALLNDTDAVPNEPVQPEPRRDVEGEVANHQGRQPDHHLLHLLGLKLLLGGVGRRRHLQHLGLYESG